MSDEFGISHHLKLPIAHYDLPIQLEHRECDDRIQMNRRPHGSAGQGGVATQADMRQP